MNWLFLSLLSALGFSLLSVVSRVVSVKSKNPRALSVAFNLVAISMALLIFIITSGYKSFVLPKSYTPYLYLFIACMFYGLYERIRFYATKHVEASLLAIISNISLVVAFIVAFLIYGELITINKIIGFLLITFSLFWISFNKVKKIELKGFLIALLGNTFLGIAWSLDKKGISYFNSETYNGFAWLLPFVFLYFFPTVKFSDVKKEIKSFSWKIVILSFLNVAGYFINLKALTIGEATRVIPVIQMSTIFTVIFGVIFLKEKEHILRKILASIMAVIGVFLLV